MFVHTLSKNEPNELRTALGNLFNEMKEAHPQVSNQQRLFRIGLTVLRHRRMSAQEAAYRLSNLQMVSMSRKTVYLNARTIANRLLHAEERMPPYG